MTNYINVLEIKYNPLEKNLTSLFPPYLPVCRRFILRTHYTVSDYQAVSYIQIEDEVVSQFGGNIFYKSPVPDSPECVWSRMKQNVSVEEILIFNNVKGLADCEAFGNFKEDLIYSVFWQSLRYNPDLRLWVQKYNPKWWNCVDSLLKI